MMMVTIAVIKMDVQGTLVCSLESLRINANLELCLLPVELQLSLPCLQFPSFGVFELTLVS